MDVILLRNEELSELSLLRGKTGMAMKAPDSQTPERLGIVIAAMAAMGNDPEAGRFFDMNLHLN